MANFLLFIAAMMAGAAVVLVLNYLKKREARDVARELVREVEAEKALDLEAQIQKIKESFGALSLEALSRNSEEFLKLARERLTQHTQEGVKELEGSKKLIDQTLESMRQDMLRVQDMVKSFEKDRESKFGELAAQLRNSAEQTGKLQETAHQLHTALAGTKTRGRWGERMAEDVLRLAGFAEGINYLKQQSLETAGTRPDYTFLLPQERKVHMDVKFPLDNYMRYLEAESETDREKHRLQFLRDVKVRIKEVTTRDYINPEENTLDYVLVFIPNEQVYGFIQEQDTTILDEALKNKVILCSPITLYAILAVIRQAMDNFSLEQTASRILSLIGNFNKQWGAFLKSMEKMGKKIDEAHAEFDNLATTRRNQLERPLRLIDELRAQKGIPAADLLPLPLEGEAAVLPENEDSQEST